MFLNYLKEYTVKVLFMKEIVFKLYNIKTDIINYISKSTNKHTFKIKLKNISIWYIYYCLYLNIQKILATLINENKISIK